MKDFTLYPEALELKQLGFDEPCLGYYLCRNSAFGIDDLEITTERIDLLRYDYASCAVPTYSQAFRWFREKYDLVHYIDRNDDKMIEYVKSKGVEDLFKYRCGYSDGTFHNIKGYHTYEEAELACLRKMIEIVKSHKK
jgi:hypothetical protein